MQKKKKNEENENSFFRLFHVLFTNELRDDVLQHRWIFFFIGRDIAPDPADRDWPSLYLMGSLGNFFCGEIIRNH